MSQLVPAYLEWKHGSMTASSPSSDSGIHAANPTREADPGNLEAEPQFVNVDKRYFDVTAVRTHGEYSIMCSVPRNERITI